MDKSAITKYWFGTRLNILDQLANNILYVHPLIVLHFSHISFFFINIRDNQIMYFAYQTIWVRSQSHCLCIDLVPSFVDCDG